MLKRHTNGVKLALIELSKHGCLVMRREVGLFYDPVDVKRLIDAVRRRDGVVPVLRPHSIGMRGEFDIQGITRAGRPIAVDVKIGSDRLSKYQIAWREAFESRGGIASAVYMDREGWQQVIEGMCRE